MLNKTLSFEKRVNKTFFKEGKQTLPTEFNLLINSYKLFILGESILFDVVLPNREKVQGQIYYGENNTGVYYQYKLSGSDNVEKLNSQISMKHDLRHSINIPTRIIDISII